MKIKMRGKSRFQASLFFLWFIIVAIIVMYTGFSDRQMEKYANYTVRQNAQTISNEVDAYVNSAVASIQLTSHLVTQMMSGRELENAGELLKTLLEQTPFDFIEYINQDGMNITDKGAAFDASDRVYYQEGMKGHTGIWINYHPKYSTEYLINFYTPLYYEDEIVGVLTGAMGADTNLLPLLGSSFYGEQMIGVLCDENGQVISTTLAMENDTCLEDIIAKYELEKNGSAVGCVLANEKTGWSVLQIIPWASLRTARWKDTGIANLVTIIIATILCLYLICIRIDSCRKQKELRAERDRTVHNYEQILTIAATDNYKAIRRVDLETAQSEYIYFENGHINQVEIGDWMTWVESQRKNVHPEDFERLKDFLDLDRLLAMEEGVTYKENYRSAVINKQGTYNSYSTTASVVFMEGTKLALLTTIDNTAAVSGDVQQRHLLVSAASIYVSMHNIDLKRDILETLNSAQHIDMIVRNRTNHVQEILRDTMSALTDEQYRQEMMNFIDFSTLDERMEGTNTITLEFLGTKSGWCRARFIAVDYDEEHRLSRVLWVVESIDAERRKANRLLYLSETDLMTGIRNRGSGETKIKELIESGCQGTFCVLDVDSFKAINDRFGHAVGDKVLIVLAGCLKESFRESDVVMRLGGDEFAVFIEEVTQKQEVLALFERLFERIERLDIPELCGQRITVSVGAAAKTTGDTLDFERLYHNADVCTYQSKEREGNTCIFFEIE